MKFVAGKGIVHCALGLLVATCTPSPPIPFPRPPTLGRHASHTRRPDANAKPPEVDRILGCPRLFGREDRGLWHEVSGERYYIDHFGRPQQAVALLPATTRDSRDARCQLLVGSWGDREAALTDHDGGHLIGFQLGGWGSRINLVPQDKHLNRGHWASLENAISSCALRLQPGRLRYVVTALYQNDVDLVPATLTATLEDTATGDCVTLAFRNEVGHAFEAKQQRDIASRWLRQVGCD